MPRIGLTQRVEVVEDYGERRDCLDQAWTTLLSAYDPVPLPNEIEHVAEYLDRLQLDGLILTSGNDLATLEDPDDTAPERDRFEKRALEYAISEQLPVLGVCRGLELLTVYFGGSLCPVSGHVSSRHAVRFDSESSTVDFPETATVNSYHDYGIKPEAVPEELDIVGRASDGTVECVRHESRPIWGIMWHPERQSPSAKLDRQLIGHLFPTENQ